MRACLCSVPTVLQLPAHQSPLRCTGRPELVARCRYSAGKQQVGEIISMARLRRLRQLIPAHLAGESRRVTTRMGTSHWTWSWQINIRTRIPFPRGEPQPWARRVVCRCRLRGGATLRRHDCPLGREITAQLMQPICWRVVGNFNLRPGARKWRAEWRLDDAEPMLDGTGGSGEGQSV